MFRAWNKDLGMTEPFTIGDLQDGKQFNFTDGEYLGIDEFGLEAKGTVLMQLTGVKDAVGQEVYEHDILVTKKGIHYLCVYSSDLGRFGLRTKNKWKSAKTHDIEYFFKPMAYIKNGLKIVGNLYQNPGLLTPTRKAVV